MLLVGGHFASIDDTLQRTTYLDCASGSLLFINPYIRNRAPALTRAVLSSPLPSALSHLRHGNLDTRILGNSGPLPQKTVLIFALPHQVPLS